MSGIPRTGPIARHAVPDNSSMSNAATEGRTAFNRSSTAERETRRESFMVKRSQPKPTLRPGPHLSMAADSAAFDQSWEQERTEAAKASKSTRKAAFMSERKNPGTQRDRSQTRTK